LYDGDHNAHQQIQILQEKVNHNWTWKAGLLLSWALMCAWGVLLVIPSVGVEEEVIISVVDVFMVEARYVTEIGCGLVG
jgi:hypothetical protein